MLDPNLRERAARRVYAFLNNVDDTADEAPFLDRAMAGGSKYVQSADEARRIVDIVAGVIGDAR